MRRVGKLREFVLAGSELCFVTTVILTPNVRHNLRIRVFDAELQKFLICSATLPKDFQLSQVQFPVKFGRDC